MCAFIFWSCHPKQIAFQVKVPQDHRLVPRNVLVENERKDSLMSTSIGGLPCDPACRLSGFDLPTKWLMKIVFIVILLLAFAGIVFSQTGNLDTDEKQTWQQREEERNLQREHDENMARKKDIENGRYKKKQQDKWEENFNIKINESLEEQ
jgi:hypothetical protein